MRHALAIALLLTCAACSQEEAPADEVAEVAEEIVAPTPEATQLAQGEWAPQDECAEVEGAATFRQILSGAVKARDTDAFVALAADDIKLDFGGGAGKAELRKRLDDEPGLLWEDLDALMTLGCAANDQGGITIPWYFDQDMGQADPFETWLVTGERVPVLTAPSPSADRLDVISWDLVELAAYDPEAAFQQIQVPDGGTGFIATDNLRSLVDYRLIASSRNGRWRITSFVAGD
jgi:hypothetical protein